MRRQALALALTLGTAVFAAAPVADAFCGFYVAGADAKLFNNATMVVMMREGTRTVLSMQNNYQGPPENFAMVVPVPVVLKKENVKTLSSDVFGRVDRLAAPRLVEYWEQDPCTASDPTRRLVTVSAREIVILQPEKAAQYGVKIEGKFSVAEYDVVILSANNSLGLDRYLRSEKYQIPAGAEAYLRPYIAHGSKFFVAKVNARKVKFQNGQAKLSPLRFHYDSETFNLPIRLGLINSAGTQDLIVHIVARSRYEVANYGNVMIPTNIRVKDSVRNSFGEFYAALFDDVVAKNPKSVVTEYAWGAGSCDPCPSPPLALEDMVALGVDVLPDNEKTGKAPPWISQLFTLTRLHARYEAKSLGEDLVFREAKPIAGGNGIPLPDGSMTPGSFSSYTNTFQGRYVMLHPWTGPIACPTFFRGAWGGPINAAEKPPIPAIDTAFAPRGSALASFIESEPLVLKNPDPVASANAPASASALPAPASSASAVANPGRVTAPEPPPPMPVSSGCASCTTARPLPGLDAVTSLVAGALVALLRYRRGRRLSSTICRPRASGESCLS